MDVQTANGAGTRTTRAYSGPGMLFATPAHEALRQGVLLMTELVRPDTWPYAADRHAV